jgi:hypothetical protein
MLIGAGISAVATGVSAISAGSSARKARRAASRTQGKIETLEQNRQEIIDPYDRMSNLGGMVSNPMTQLTVATEAAEFQAEEEDISLANTLDQMRAFGMGGGGATALAQGALQSKRGISAKIRQEEAKNTMFRAQGEQQAMTMRMNEARRMQSMEAQGRAYMWEGQENRTMSQLDRLSKTQTNYQQQEMAAWGAQQQAISSGISAVGGMFSAGISAGAFSGGGSGSGSRTLMPVSVLGSYGKQGGCFIKNSKVHMDDGTLKSIQDVKTGDEVKSLNGKVKVKNVLVHDINDIERIYNNSSCYTTDEHPLYINNRWTNAKELNWNSESQFVDKLYNLETESTFIINNVVASGKIEKVNKELELKLI